MSTSASVIGVEGLREYQAKLRELDSKAPRRIRVVLNNAAQIVVSGARPLIPRRTGAAASSVRVQSTQREARVKGGSAKVPYYPWLDFGGKVGEGGRVDRPFYREGRYIYPTLTKRRAEVIGVMVHGLEKLAREVGI